MKHVFHALLLLAAALSLTSCPNSAPGGGAVGPYDAHGNYVEAWADDPSKWRHPARDVGAIAKNDQPPAHMTPLPPRGQPEILLPPTKPTTSRSKPTVAKTTSRPRPTVAKTTSTPKPKPKPKPKPVPKTVRHTIKRGDTLSGLAKKYGTSVSAIQRANNLSGTLIREGKSLTIPRKK